MSCPSRARSEGFQRCLTVNRGPAYAAPTWDIAGHEAVRDDLLIRPRAAVLGPAEACRLAFTSTLITCWRCELRAAARDEQAQCGQDRGEGGLQEVFPAAGRGEVDECAQGKQAGQCPGSGAGGAG